MPIALKGAVANRRFPTIYNPIPFKEEGSLDQRMAFYDHIASQLGLKRSIWSIFEVVDFNKVPFPDVKWLRYKFNSGLHVADRPINGWATWGDLWWLADEMIRASEDCHHIYIECFERDPSDPSVLTFYCGS
jgi:hypothetical protein